MEYRRLPRGGEEISVLGLGAAYISEAGDCVACGHCDRRCPFRVRQSGRMKEISDYFGK